MSQPLSPFEREFIAELLSTAADESTDRSCNDFPLPLSDEHKAIAIASIRHMEQTGWEDEQPAQTFIDDVQASTEQVVAFDNWLAPYLAQRCKTAQSPLSAVEIGVIAELLVAQADTHDDIGSAEFSIDVPATPAHKALVAAALEHGAAKGWQAKAKKVLAAKEPIEMPDLALLRYCADRCLGKAAPPKNAEAGAPGEPGARLGISPKFPKLAKYLETWGPGMAGKWRDGLPKLERYAQEGPFKLRSEHDIEYDFGYRGAGKCLDDMAQTWRWHAIHAACGHDPTPPAPVPMDAAACLAEMKELRVKPRRVFNPYDQEENKDKLLAEHFCFKSVDPAGIEQALLATSAHVAALPEPKRAAYARAVVQKATSKKEIRDFLVSEARERESAATFVRDMAGDWKGLWNRAAAYACYGSKVNMLSQFPDMFDATNTVVDALLRGWHAQALNVADMTRQVFVRQVSRERPFQTQWFVLRLLADWQKDPFEFPPLTRTEPLFDALLANWRTPDVAQIQELLLAACDRHTHQARHDTGKITPDLCHTCWYDPFEVLAVLYLRRVEGLANPELDHPLMRTPLAVLPEPVPFRGDALLDAVVAKMRLEWSNV